MTGDVMPYHRNVKTLSSVEDYCFLSDPGETETFIVEYSGRVRLYHENDSPPLPSLREEAELPSLCTLPRGKRHWKGGYLPVLQISGPGVSEELFASGRELFRRSEQGCRAYPGDRKVALAEYDDRLKKVTRYWERFLGSLEALPGVNEWAGNAWKSSFVQSFSAFWGTHTKYGVEEYGCMRHDGFPPTLLAAAGALHEFGNTAGARTLFLRYLERFLRPEGTLRYYGTALSEYGGLLRLGSELSQGPEGNEFFAAVRRELLLICRLMRDLLDCVMNPPASRYALLAGSPEADLRERKGEYLHNNAAVLRGMECLIPLLERHGVLPDLLEVRDLHATLERRFEAAVRDLGARYPFLPYKTTDQEEITDFTADMEWAFANYRYYPELLESGIPASSDAEKIIRERFARKGMFRGLTALNYPAQFLLCFDHWPHVSLGRGLLEYGDIKHFHEILTAHASLYMDRDLFTCYESELPGTPMKAYTDWCVPAQLVFPRLLRMCTGFRRRSGELIIPSLPEIFKK